MKFLGLLMFLFLTYFLSGCNSNANEIVLTESGDTTFVEGNSLIFATYAYRQYSAKGLLSLEYTPFDGYAIARNDFGADSTMVKKMNTFLISTKEAKTAINAGDKQVFVFVVKDNGEIVAFESYQNNEEKIASLLGIEYKKREDIQATKEKEVIQPDENQKPKDTIIKNQKMQQDSLRKASPRSVQSIKPIKE